MQKDFRRNQHNRRCAMTRHTTPYSSRKHSPQSKRRSRHRRIRLPENILLKWKVLALLRGQHPKQAFEQAVKDMELLYACLADGEVTTLIHQDEVITPLTPVFLIARTLSPLVDGAYTKTVRIPVSSETYFRAQNISRYTKLPMSIVFSLAINIDLLLSSPSVKEIKISRHSSFFPPDFL